MSDPLPPAPKDEPFTTAGYGIVDAIMLGALDFLGLAAISSVLWLSLGAGH